MRSNDRRLRMLVQSDIQTCIDNAKYYSGILLNKIVLQESGGEDATGLKNKFNLLGRWIPILEQFKADNFGSNGNLIPPIYTCLTIDQALELVAKVYNLIGCDNLIPENTKSDWILATGFWNDAGFWRDSATWNDSLPII